MLTRLRNLLEFYASLAWRSFTDTNVYLRAGLLPLRLLITYSLLWSMIVAVGHTAHFWLRSVPTLHSTGMMQWEELGTNWPENLELRFENGVWSKTVADDVIVPYPTGFDRPDSWPSTLAVLSSSEPSGSSSPNGSLLVAGPATFAVFSPNRPDAQVFVWNEVLSPDQTLVWNKAVVQSNTPRMEIALRTLLYNLTIGVFVWRAFGVWSLRLIGLVLYAWLAQMLWTFRGRQLAFGTVYKMGLIILPVAEVLMLLWTAFWPSMAAPLSFWWIWLLVMGLIVLTAPRK